MKLGAAKPIVGTVPTRSIRMRTIEKISVALPPEMVATVRQAVATGEYASNSEVVRDAIRDWTQKRSLQQSGVEELHRVWAEARKDTRPSLNPDEVLDRLERKYQSMVAGHPG